MRVGLLLISSLLASTACQDQTSIQKVYSGQRDLCQSTAESNITDYVNPMQDENEEDRNAQLVTLFSDCMFTQGWTVATPEREGGASAGGVGVGASIRPGRSFTKDQFETQPTAAQNTNPQAVQPQVVQPRTVQPQTVQPPANVYQQQQVVPAVPRVEAPYSVIRQRPVTNPQAVQPQVVPQVSTQ